MRNYVGALAQKVSTLTVAFVLVFSSIAAGVPLLLSQVAEAADTITVSSPKNDSFIRGIVTFAPTPATGKVFQGAYIEFNKGAGKQWKTDNTKDSTTYVSNIRNGANPRLSVNTSLYGGDGLYGLKINATYTDGSTDSYTASYTVDNTLPNLTLKVNGNADTPSGTVLSGNVRLEGLSDDLNPHVLYLAIFKPGNEGYHAEKVLINDNTGLSSVDKVWNTKEVADGTYTIRFEAKDKADNDTKKDVQVVVDNSAPLLSGVTFGSTAVTSNVALRGSNTFTVNLTESNPRRTYVEVNVLVNNKWSKIAGNESTGSAANIATLAFNTTGLSETAVYQLKISSDDSVGNHAGYSIPFVIDNTAPVLGGVTYGSTPVTPGVVLSGTDTFAVNLEETNPNRTYVEVQQLVDGKWSKIAGNESTGATANTATLNFDTIIRNKNAQYQLKISTDDAARNHSGFSIPFTIDNTGLKTPFVEFQQLFPTNFGLSDHSYAYGQYNNPTALWHGTPGVQWYLVYESTEGWTTTNGQVPGKTVVAVRTFTTGEPIPTVSAEDLGVLNGTEATFWVHLVPFEPTVGEPYPADAAYTRAWAQVTIDRLAPVVTINSYAGIDTTPTISGTVNERLDVTVTIAGIVHDIPASALLDNGDGTYIWSVAVTTPLAVGTHAVTVSATDSAGNPSTQTVANAIVIGAVESAATVAIAGPQQPQFPATPPAPRNTNGVVASAATTSDITGNVSESDGNVLAATTADGDEVDGTVEEGNTSNGFNWWWILPILAAFFFIILAVRRRKDKDEA